MNFKKMNFMSLILFAITLSSCGYGLKEYYSGDAYNSGNFQKDYYRVWDKRIDSSNEKNSIVDSSVNALSEDIDYVFENYNDLNFRLCDQESQSSLTFADDYYGGEPDYYLNVGYGPTKKLSRTESSFKYGYLSKLFDGQMFCHGRFQLARVQIDEGGFGAIFNKETDNLDYIAMSFKASYDYTHSGEYDFNNDGQVTQSENVPSGIRTGVNLKVSLYSKVDKGFEKNTFTYKVNDIITNGSENPLDPPYKFFGFRLGNHHLSRVCGISIEFDFDRTNETDNPLYYLKDGNGQAVALDYSLMLYEVFLPNTTWN